MAALGDGRQKGVHDRQMKAMRATWQAVIDGRKTVVGGWKTLVVGWKAIFGRWKTVFGG
jgi:hypothetical protein